MILSKQIKENNKLPHFIRFAEAFRREESYSKIFPHIGLKNFSTKVSDIRSNFLYALKSSRCGVKIDLQDADLKQRSKIIQGLYSAIGTPIFLAGVFCDFVDLRRFKSKKENAALRVVFSGDGNQSAWDIATMSMRGIESCQSWSSRRAHHLVGSIVDPCCAIMYLEDESTSSSYGSKMLYRVIVRYVVHEEFGPHLFMEQLYPCEEDEATGKAINVMFALLLYKYSRMPVIYHGFGLGTESIYKGLFIPESKAVNNNLHSASYRDSNIQYKSVGSLINKFPSLASIKEKFFS
jgi:hypothetical protein